MNLESEIEKKQLEEFNDIVHNILNDLTFSTCESVEVEPSQMMKLDVVLNKVRAIRIYKEEAQKLFYSMRNYVEYWENK